MSLGPAQASWLMWDGLHHDWCMSVWATEGYEYCTIRWKQHRAALGSSEELVPQRRLLRSYQNF